MGGNVLLNASTPPRWPRLAPDTTWKWVGVRWGERKGRGFWTGGVAQCRHWVALHSAYWDMERKQLDGIEEACRRMWYLGWRERVGSRYGGS